MQRTLLLLTCVVLIFVAIEVVWSRIRARKVYNVKESLCNLSIAAFNGIQRPVTLAWSVFVLSLTEPLQVYRLPDTVWSFFVTFVIADCAYYWYHRLTHEVPLLWTMHHTHHSSPWMNLTTALRLNWVAKYVSPLFFAPLVLIGFSPLVLGASLALGLLYQFLLHTEAIGRLGWFEGKLLNTPSAHRVHHGSNDEYIDKNYAGVFIIWDQLFGTYQAEESPVRYGVTTGFLSHNPLLVQFQPLWQCICGQWRREQTIAADRAAAHRGRKNHEHAS